MDASATTLPDELVTAIVPIPLASFAGEPSSSIGKAFLKSYAANLAWRAQSSLLGLLLQSTGCIGHLAGGRHASLKLHRRIDL